jgi:hypothetical protein
MRSDTKQRKKARMGLRMIAGESQMLGLLTGVL